MSDVKVKACAALEKYIRCIVYVDDEAVSCSNESNTKTAAAATQARNVLSKLFAESTKQDRSCDGKRTVDSESKSVESCVISEYAHGIQQSFAAHSMVCGYYKPDKNELINIKNSGDASSSRIVSLCKKADLFILDWKLNYGNEAITSDKILECFLKDEQFSEIGHSVRFCVIYTSCEAAEVMPTVARMMGVHYDETKQYLDGKGVTVIFAKKPRMGLNINSEAERTALYEVSATSLADYAIHIIADLNSGILRRFALNGISSIRREANRILGRFGNSLDAEFAMHCGLTRAEDNAYEDLVMLLADEVRSVLEDDETLAHETNLYVDGEEYVKGLDDDILTEAIEEAKASGKEGKGEVPVVKQECSFKGDSFKEMLIRRFTLKENGKAHHYNDFKKVFLECKGGDTLREVSPRILRWFKSLCEKVSGSNYQFGGLAELFSSRASYGVAKTLRLGTVIKREDDYYLCVMPSCDCCRLSGETQFLFWKLEQKDVPSGGGHGFCLKHNDQFKHFVISGKTHKKMSVMRFVPEKGHVRFIKSDSGFVVEDRDRVLCQETGEIKINPVQCFWVGELKYQHALRSVDRAAGNLRRVGLSEFEWTRLLMGTE